MKEFIESFLQSSDEDVANHVDISTGNAHEILLSELELRKVQVLWVPHCLTSLQKATRLQNAEETLQFMNKATLDVY